MTIWSRISAKKEPWTASIRIASLLFYYAICNDSISYAGSVMPHESLVKPAYVVTVLSLVWVKSQTIEGFNRRVWDDHLNKKVKS